MARLPVVLVWAHFSVECIPTQLPFPMLTQREGSKSGKHVSLPKNPTSHMPPTLHELAMGVARRCLPRESSMKILALIRHGSTFSDLTSRLMYTSPFSQLNASSLTSVRLTTTTKKQMAQTGKKLLANLRHLNKTAQSRNQSY